MPETLDTLHREHADALRSRLRRRFPALGDQVDDAVQVAFTRLATQPEPVERPAAWLHRVATNWCLDQLRRRHATVAVEDAPADAETLAVGPPTLSATTTRTLTVRMVREALADLGPRDRELLLAMYAEGTPYPKLAERFGLAVASVGRTLDRARARFRRAFEDARRARDAA
jgi:RNA polymerase sigma-70 factor (ECF subfamily)